MESALLTASDRSVPRYTSYPTAAEFNAPVGAERHRKWLATLNGETAALYLHVPFCRQLCWYCACHTMAMHREGTLDSNAAALSHELSLTAQAAPGLFVGSIQWGGGTPTLARLEGDGLVALENCRIAVTEHGRPLVRFVCAAFDRHYTGAEGRHARGI